MSEDGRISRVGSIDYTGTTYLPALGLSVCREAGPERIERGGWFFVRVVMGRWLEDDGACWGVVGYGGYYYGIRCLRDKI